MKSRWFKCLIGLFLASVVLPLQAANLMDVYYQAVHSDPTFKKAEADWRSAKENLPIARSFLLPQFDILGNYDRQYSHSRAVILRAGNGTNYNYGYTLALTQPIFNFADWNAIKSAKASVKAATATYAAAAQDLMVRTVRAYFAVLQAYDQLRYTLARKRAVHEQLMTAQERFKVGLIAITGVYDARSSYDQTVATEIADQNTLNDRVEKLREITGRHYTWLLGVRRSVPLVTPIPNDIYQWVHVAERQNYSLRAQNFTVKSALETVKQQSAAWMPQANFVGDFTENYNTSLPLIPNTSRELGTLGVALNFPLFQGGLVSAQTRQARYNYLSQSGQLQFVHRQVVSETRQSFLGVITGIRQVKADLQTIKSAQNDLEATKAGYDVGTRTMFDILTKLTVLYQRQQRHADDQYTYIIDTIELKANAGTLSVPDIAKVNAWLSKRVKLNVPKAAYGSKRRPVATMKPLKVKRKARLKKKTRMIKAHKPHRHNKWILMKKPKRLSRSILSRKKSLQKRKRLLPKLRRMTSLQMQLPAPKRTWVTAKKTVSLDDRIVPLYSLSR